MIFSSYLPDKILNNNEFEDLGWSSRKIFDKTGIYERRIVGENQTALDMAVIAAKKIFLEGGADKEKVDYLIYCTQSPDFVIPNNSSLLHMELGLNESCASVDINQGCTGYLYGMSLAKGLLASNQARHVLLVTSDTYSKYINSKDRANKTIFGDGASATLISIEDLAGIGEFIFGTNGEGAFDLCVKSSGLKYPKSLITSVETLDASGNLRSDDNLFMNGAAVFSFALDKVPKSVFDVLVKNNLDFNDVDFFVFHQANAFMLEHLRDKLGISVEKFPVEMAYTGNTVSSTIPLVLEKYFVKGALSQGTKCLIVGFGVGYSWSATILTF